MKKVLVTLLLLVTALVAVLGLSSCTSWDSPYLEYDKEGSTVSVEFLPDLPGAETPAQFDSKSGVTVIDVHNLGAYTADKDGNVSIKILDPTDANRGNKKKTLDKTGHIFVGWYTLVSTKDDNGNTVYEYGERWDLASKSLTLKKDGSYTSTEPQLTLVAKWAPYITYKFLYQNDAGEWVYMTSGDGIITKNQISVDLPFWDESSGKLQYVNNFPKRSGYTFVGAFYDEEMTDAIVGKAEGEYDADGNPISTEVNVYTTWREGEWVRIYNASQLTNVSRTSCIELMADIDFKGIAWPTALLTGEFIGKIYGNGYTISNVSANGVSNKNATVYLAGLFGAIGEEAEIKDVTFENVTYSVKSSHPSSIATFALFSANNKSDKVENVTVKNSKIVLTYEFLDSFRYHLTDGDTFEVYTFASGKTAGITKDNVTFEVETEKKEYDGSTVTLDVTVTEDADTGRLIFVYPAAPADGDEEPTT